MSIENKCSTIAIAYQQHGNTDQNQIDIIDANQAQTFTWSDHYGIKELRVEFYLGAKY